MSPTTGVRDVVASYSEMLQVELPAIELLQKLSWEYANLYSESFGEKGTEGRESEHQVVLIRRLRAALERLNPQLPDDAYEQAIQQLTRDRSKQLAVNANHEVYDLIKEDEAV
jgi:type I restriction enzyme R subunit